MPSRRALCPLLLGGLAAVAAPVWAQPPVGDDSGSYTIQRGDTLSGITHRLGVSNEETQQANDLTHPDQLSAGYIVRLPVVARPPSAAPPAAPTAATPAPTASPEKAAATPVAPPPAAPSQTSEAGDAGDTDQLAVGTYVHPTLGTLRVSKGPDGVILNKDNKIIPMRRLLYAIYDGTDAVGNVHNIDFLFDDAGHVSALRYLSGGAGQITFEKMKK